MIPNLAMQGRGNQTSEDDDLAPSLITQAMNNSFIRRMSDAPQLDTVEDLLQVINFFALTQIKAIHGDLSQRRWCVVELDETVFSSGGMFGSLATCGASSSSDATDRPLSCKLYCLVLNMDNRELHFQSFEDPDKHLFINFDTIPVEFMEIGEKHPFKNELISLKAHDMNIDMYISTNTMPYPYSVKCPTKQQEFEALSSKRMLAKLLRESIAESRGQQLSLNSVLKYESEFSKRRFITEEQFTKYCETGDILLFRDNHTMAKVQRVLSNSQFDHVGVVYKSERYGICLFESNSGLGVAVAVWNQLIRHHWFKNIERITWRKLQVDNKPHDFDERVTEFVKANLHKKFNLSLPKLLKFKSNIPHSEKTSYFCSELVGTLYKFLGLLDPEKSATQYWPKDFSDKGNLNMINSALDPERQIIFEDKLLKLNYPFYKV